MLATLKTGRAERALSEQEAHARAILDLSPQVLWTARRDGGIEDFAERWLEWTGLTRAEALGESWARVPHPDDLPRVAEAWSHALATGQPYDSEHRIRMADGSYRWMRSRAVPRRDPASDAVLRWYGATEDVHDRHEAEAALREGEARFRATFEQAAVGMAHVALDGTWLRVNHRLCTKLGYTAAELRARTFQDITHPDDLEADINNARRLLAGEVANYSMEKRYIRKDGATLWAELTVALVRDAAGAPLYFISAIANISARKAAETALRDLAATLEARVGERTRQLSEVVAELDAFAYSVSHDLRAPLRAMEGFARILLEDHAEALGPEGRRYAGRIVAAAARMEGLIQDLLAYSRLSRDAVELVPVELDRAVDRAVAELREGGAPGGAQAEVAVRRPMPRVLASRVVLGQILANLLSNAAKFTLPDQPARIRAWAEERPGDRVRLWVEDEGIGLAPGHLGRVFNVFERLHGQESYPGTGIGLAIVRKGAERLGGAGRRGRRATVRAGAAVFGWTCRRRIGRPRRSARTRRSERGTGRGGVGAGDRGRGGRRGADRARLPPRRHRQSAGARHGRRRRGGTAGRSRQTAAGAGPAGLEAAASLRLRGAGVAARRRRRRGGAARARGGPHLLRPGAGRATGL